MSPTKQNQKSANEVNSDKASEDVLSKIAELPLEQRQLLAKAVNELNRTEREKLKLPVPPVGSKLKVKDDAPKDIRGTQVEVIASGRGNGGHTYAFCRVLPNGGTRFVHLKHLAA